MYVSECLRMISENTANMSRGSYMTTKFKDVIKPAPVDYRTGEEIAADVIKKCGLKVVS